jgi:3-phenylpropionate/cinnamic acid dioxygenase small subunit
MEGTALALQLEVQEFLYREAALLEADKYQAWLALLSEDIVYRMPVRYSRQPGTGAETEGFSLYNEDKKSLELRIRRLDTGIAHAEAPPSHTLRLITNVMAREEGAEIEALSSFVVYQERNPPKAYTFMGRRRDHLRRSGGGLQIARREIRLAQTILPTTISIFF